MAENRVNGSGTRVRSGAQTLVLLSTSPNVSILRALSDGPKQQGELRGETGSPAQTTLRAQLKRLAEIGAVNRERRNGFPGALLYELTPAGRELLFVTDALEHWLELAPGSPLFYGDSAARAAIKALAEGWSTRMLRALAARSLSLTDLDRIIAELSYPALERRLAGLRLTGQVEARPSPGRSTPYGVTRWAREGVAPLAAAARWERTYAAALTKPIGRHDVEGAFLLGVPLVRLSPAASGSCRMGVEMSSANGRRLCGVVVHVEAGKVTSCATDLQGSVNAWALGPSAAWLDAVVAADPSGLELGGDCSLARALLDSLHETLFPSARADAPQRS